MRKTQEIETMQDLEYEIRKSKIRLQNIRFFIDREITYAQEMIMRSGAIVVPQESVKGNHRQLAFRPQSVSFWKRLANEAGQRIKSVLMETVFSILIQQIQLKSQNINK